MCKHALPTLRMTKGSFVNVSSYDGLVGFAGASGYAASKAAIFDLTLSKIQRRVPCECCLP